ncbi:hypothetical protein [Zymobacter palmae]|uniref:hypothetical protein n=1 Tax=Zymobacter palmae TaxID=33074 RepID=UPI00068678CE|nr:hypothetical protein [Zymobacter palmae]
MKKVICFLLATSWSLFVCPLAAAEDECSSYKKADMVLDNIYSSWNNIFYYYKNYGGCLDGYYGEGTTEAVAQRLANHWEETSSIAPLINNTEGFESFILYNINSSADDKELLKINELSKEACPEGMTDFCRKLEKTSADAYNDLNS